MRRSWILVVVLLVAAGAAGAAPGAPRSTVGTSFPPGFPLIGDASLGVPVIGFGDAGPCTGRR
jgi:hypothetical protein